MSAWETVLGAESTAWPSRSAGRCGANPVSARARASLLVMAVAAARAWPSRSAARCGANPVSASARQALSVIAVGRAVSA